MVSGATQDTVVDMGGRSLRCLTAVVYRETYISQQTFFTVIDIGNSDFTLRNVVVVVDIVGQEAHVCCLFLLFYNDISCDKGKRIDFKLLKCSFFFELFNRESFLVRVYIFRKFSLIFFVISFGSVRMWILSCKCISSGGFW